MPRKKQGGVLPFQQDGHKKVDAPLVGKDALWSIKLTNRSSGAGADRRVPVVTFIVRVVEAQTIFGRIDYLVETNTGDRLWVSEHTLAELPPPGKSPKP